MTSKKSIHKQGQACESEQRFGTERSPNLTLSAAQASARPWWEVADLLASNIRFATELCTTMALPIAEIKALWLLHLRIVDILKASHDAWRADPAVRGRLNATREMIQLELRGEGTDSTQATTQAKQRMEQWYHTEELRGLHTAMQGFGEALKRRNDASLQAKYAEARLSSRRAVMENHNPLLDGLPTLVQTLRRVCSSEVATYTVQDVGLSPEHFLDVIHILARDQVAAADVPNPRARVRAALSRAQRRNEMLARGRWMPATEAQMERLSSAENLESRITVKLDWDRAKRDLCLPSDQARAVEARIEGYNLQASEVSGDFDWDPARMQKVRRSLEPDRRWGRRLRQRLSAYAPNREL